MGDRRTYHRYASRARTGEGVRDRRYRWPKNEAGYCHLIDIGIITLGSEFFDDCLEIAFVRVLDTDNVVTSLDAHRPVKQ